MHLKYRNVNDAFNGVVSGIHTGAIPTVVSSSRNGEVLYVEEPVIVSYSHPRERVLFNTARDCNPFLHLYESLWMLAGRNDVAPLAYFAENFKSYSDDGQTLNGAYGYRWRNHRVFKNLSPYHDMNGLSDKQQKDLSRESSNGIWGSKQVDQLDILIQHLREKPNTRRAVLTMWNVDDDLLKLDTSRDVCCNTHVYFQIENGTCSICKGRGYVSTGPSHLDDKPCASCNGLPNDQPRSLNMTVCNRSNDAIWGMLGANVVHFSFLQEYVACSLGLEVGTYNQMTNNLHIYTETNSGWEPKKWLTARSLAETFPADSYGSTACPLFKLSNIDTDLEASRQRFDKECRLFANLHWRPEELTADTGKQFDTFFLRHTADPMMNAFHMHKQRDYSAALHWCGKITAPDWRLAATAWITKRKLGWERKQREGAESRVDG